MISINWGVRIINVPKLDMALIQSIPTEIRELNLNAFRLALKDLEDDEEGMPYPKTHNHNTETPLGGITYARVIEIINGYTVTFEDGQYSVNLIGANSNVGDKTNVNQVSVRSNNSAGLTSSPVIEHVSFNGCVTIDTSSMVSGTVYPAGTPRFPVNNIADALTIAEYRGIYTLYVVGNLTFGTTDDLTDFEIKGEGEERTVITLTSGCVTTNSIFKNLSVQGTQNGDARYEDCEIRNLSNIHCKFLRCRLNGLLTMHPTAQDTASLYQCYSHPAGLNYITLDMNNGKMNMSWRDFNGSVKVINSNQSEVDLSFGFGSGKLEIDSTVSAGTIIVSGSCELVDNSTSTAIVYTRGSLVEAIKIAKQAKAMASANL
jgi:hypothetical protein